MRGSGQATNIHFGFCSYMKSKNSVVYLYRGAPIHSTTLHDTFYPSTVKGKKCHEAAGGTDHSIAAAESGPQWETECVFISPNTAVPVDHRRARRILRVSHRARDSIKIHFRLMHSNGC